MALKSATVAHIMLYLLDNNKRAGIFSFYKTGARKPRVFYMRTAMKRLSPRLYTMIYLIFWQTVHKVM